MDAHADRRDAKHAKARRGMKVSGRSAILLHDLRVARDARLVAGKEKS